MRKKSYLLFRKMNRRVYKSCGVPQCVNTSIKTPEKLFIYVPNNRTTRYKWLKLARRDPNAVKLNTSIYFCEDHFDLPNTMANFMEYHLMGFVSQVRMKPGCIPTKFECQPGRKRTSDITEQPYMVKQRKIIVIEDAINNQEGKDITSEHSELGEPSRQVVPEVLETITQENKTADKSVQVYITHKFRSKAVQTGIKCISQMTSPMKPDLKSTLTTRYPMKNKPTTSNKDILSTEDQSDSDNSYKSSLLHGESSLGTISLEPKSTSDCNGLIQDDNLEYTIVKITRNPHFYLGVPKKCYYLIDLIQKYTNIPDIHILMCLKKIRLNNPFLQIGDDFAITSTDARMIFFKNIPLLASVLRPFIVNLNKDSIKKTLPIAFRHKYSHVSCIINILEIEIQKPSKAFNQSLSWSVSKRAYTIKYLISCTPNGLVNYISPACGGRVSDTCLAESCDFIQCLEPGMCVMADRRFKHVESYFLKHGVTVVRPPSVTTGVKLSRQKKQVVSLRLRIHIETVIRRLREFNMLKPHACISHNTLKVLDDVVTIACGLINLQDSVIR